ncbi:MAG: hypothetical protein JO250_04650, partial [Armatimonadetes bacterium]|nr:hypothetical protein [Armatimonadota bacterium]
PPAPSPAQRARAGQGKRLSTFGLLMLFVAIWFLGLIAYTMVHVLRHPLTELPRVNVQQPKED